MEPQIDEVDTIEIEIEDMEAQKYLANDEGQIDRTEMKQAMQAAKSPTGQKKKFVQFQFEPLEEEKKEEMPRPVVVQALSMQEERDSRRRGRRFRRFLKFLPLTREKLTKMRNVRILNEYKESSGKQQVFTCLFCVYWLCNTVLGLFLISEYGEYLRENYAELGDCVLMFALKWFTSIVLALSLILLISLGSSMRCFMGDTDEIKASIVGMAFPVYCFCVILQQLYASGYGFWFLSTVRLGKDVPDGTPVFSTMDPDCLDLTSIFFLNECVVGVLTFFQCCGLFLCSTKSKHLLEIDGEDDDAEKRVAYYKQQLEEKRIQCSSTPETRDSI